MAALLAASAVSAAPDWRTQATARARLHAARLALLAGKYRDIPNNYAVRRWEEAQLDRALRDLAAPAAPSNAPGSHLEAYLDDLDGSAQPFWALGSSRKVSGTMGRVSRRQNFSAGSYCWGESWDRRCPKHQVTASAPQAIQSPKFWTGPSRQAAMALPSFGFSAMKSRLIGFTLSSALWRFAGVSG